MKEKQAFERLEVKKETLLEMFKVGCLKKVGSSIMQLFFDYF